MTFNRSQGNSALKKNIVFLIDTLQTGGAERSLLEMVVHFRKYNPVMVQLFRGKNDLKPEFERAGIKVFSLELPSSYKTDLISCAAAECMIGINTEIIHSTLFKSDLVSRSLIGKLKVPLLNSLVNNSYSRQRYKAEPWPVKCKLWILQQWDAITAKRVTLFVSNSRTIKFSNARALKVPLDKIRVIYRGRSADPFMTITKNQTQALRQEINAVDKTVFLNVSRLIDRKGQLDLIRAFHKVINQKKDCLLWIAGEGLFRKNLEDEINLLGLQEQVKLLGNRGDVALLLKAADFFVFPSHYEGLPGAIIEAMFAKVPIIASSIPENLECVNEEMALLHPAHDIHALSKQMIDALKDAHWHDRTQKAFDYAMEHFEISKIAEQYEKLYDEVLAKWKVEL